MSDQLPSEKRHPLAKAAGVAIKEYKNRSEAERVQILMSAEFARALGAGAPEAAEAIQHELRRALDLENDDAGSTVVDRMLEALED